MRQAAVVAGHVGVELLQSASDALLSSPHSVAPSRPAAAAAAAATAAAALSIIHIGGVACSALRSSVVYGTPNRSKCRRPLVD